MNDPVTTIGLTTIAVGLVLYLRAEERRRSVPFPSKPRPSMESIDRQENQNGIADQSRVSPTLTPNTDIPLAASLPVRDVVNPPEITELPPIQHSELVGVDLTPVTEATEMSVNDEGDRPTALEEIFNLGEAGEAEAIARLSQHLEDPDYTVRAAVAAALGDLATHWQGPRLDEALTYLKRLRQDASPDVRMEAATALAKLSGGIFTGSDGP